MLEFELMKISGLSDIPEEAQEIVIKAIVDLNSYFDDIKNSKKFTGYKENSEIMGIMFFSTLVAFMIGQVVDIAKKAKIVEKKTYRCLTPEERFGCLMNGIMEHLHFVAQKTFDEKLP